MNRRDFAGTCLMAAGTAVQQSSGLGVWKALGRLQEEDGATPIEGGRWFSAQSPGDGMLFEFPAGTLAKSRALTADMLLDGKELAVFLIILREGEKGRGFRFSFGALNQCSFRMRLDLSLVDQGRWMSDREGAFLKPLCSGDRVDLALVDRISFTVSRTGPGGARWAMTPLQMLPALPPKLTTPVLPKGPLVDEFGQSALRDWPGKTRSLAELTSRVRRQFEDAPGVSWPGTFSKWGGLQALKLGEGTGWFRTQKHNGRWWLVDPAGCAFWSAGLDCVRVDTDARVDGIEGALKWIPGRDEFPGADRTSGGGRSQTRFINYLAANMVRALGPEGWRDKWAHIALAEMKRMRFNTVANWSDWEFAARAGFPYVRPLSFRGSRSPMVYRDFPDVFHSGFEQDATEYSAALASTAADPAFIGYFLMNEPTWAFSSELPAAGMLYNMPVCAARDELARFLRRRHEGDDALARAWNIPATFERIVRGKWSGVFSKEALADLREFSAIMVERYFQTLSKACRQADPHHLNLGMRWAGVPPEWAVRGMKSFDVFSLNSYTERLPRLQSENIHALLAMPVMVGEWHFGALDAGLPASGIGHLRNQADRARAYRVYLEDAAANPYCVGAHWFTLYDQSALGRFDGENYNIGFLDVCNRPYEEMALAATASHERMYAVACGEVQPFAEAPEYLPKLFL